MPERRMLVFYDANEMVKTKTWFKQPKRRLYAWPTPYGVHRNQNDYILVKKRWRSSVQSAKTLPEADCGSDHELLVADIHLKLKKVKKADTITRLTILDMQMKPP
eukprot:gene1857-16350_t